MKTGNIEYYVADPAGNVTILVSSPVPREKYQEVAKALLATEPSAEQVGFIVDEDGGERMEMAGLEFCGNASRAFAFYRATKADPALEEVDVTVSGSPVPLHTWITVEEGPGEDPDSGRRRIAAGRVKIEMPLPVAVEELRIPAEAACGTEIRGRLVRIEGIDHLVMKGVSADRELVERILAWFYGEGGFDSPAFGMMFLQEDREHLTPVVYVRDVDTTYFEGSCASGSLATAWALALEEEGDRQYTLRQPAGELTVSVIRGQEKDQGLLDGTVSLME